MTLPRFLVLGIPQHQGSSPCQGLNKGTYLRLTIKVLHETTRQEQTCYKVHGVIFSVKPCQESCFELAQEPIPLWWTSDFINSSPPGTDAKESLEPTYQQLRYGYIMVIYIYILKQVLT